MEYLAEMKLVEKVEKGDFIKMKHNTLMTEIQTSSALKIYNTPISCYLKKKFKAEFESQNYVLPGTEIPKIEFPCLVLYEDS